MLIDVRCGQFFYESIQALALVLKKKSLTGLLVLLINHFLNTSPTGKNTLLLVAVAAVQCKRVMCLTKNLINLK